MVSVTRLLPLPLKRALDLGGLYTGLVGTTNPKPQTSNSNLRPQTPQFILRPTLLTQALCGCKPWFICYRRCCRRRLRSACSSRRNGRHIQVLVLNAKVLLIILRNKFKLMLLPFSNSHVTSVRHLIVQGIRHARARVSLFLSPQLPTTPSPSRSSQASPTSSFRAYPLSLRSCLIPQMPSIFFALYFSTCSRCTLAPWLTCTRKSSQVCCFNNCEFSCKHSNHKIQIVNLLNRHHRACFKVITHS